MSSSVAFCATLSVRVSPSTGWKCKPLLYRESSADRCVFARLDSQKKSRKGFGREPSKPSSAGKHGSASEEPTVLFGKSTSIPPAEDIQNFVPRGPTMREQFVNRGLLEPESASTAGQLPQVVADRMIRRIASFGGIPLALLMAFFVAYFIARYAYDVRVIPVFVAYSTLGCIGATGIGITYGIMSSSWDENDEGSLLGWKEATANFLRVKDGLANQKNREQRDDEDWGSLNYLNDWLDKERNTKHTDKE